VPADRDAVGRPWTVPHEWPPAMPKCFWFVMIIFATTNEAEKINIYRKIGSKSVRATQK
jgi:hypothetical protein